MRLRSGFERVSIDDVGLRDYIDAQFRSEKERVDVLFREKERALDMASNERDRAAEVLRDEQRRAIATAETEREKAASALRDGTARSISDNYARLTELVGATRDFLMAKIESTQREATHAQAASEKAILKAEASDSERFHSHNGLIEQMRQQAEKSEQNAQAAAAEFAQRDLVDQAFKDLQRQITELHENVAVGPADLKMLRSTSDQQEGHRAQAAESSTQQKASTGLWITLAGVIVAAATIVAIVLSSHSGTLCVVAGKVVGC
jgi:hypothetical protein